MKTIVTAAAALLLTACQTMQEGPARATAQLQPTKGSQASGEATFEQRGDKVHVVVSAQGLKAGQEHGLHIHEAGDCSSGDGMSAKGHFNPHGKPHGPQGGSERHAGDMPSLKADQSGRGKLEADLDIMTVTPGPAGIVGRGLIIHADSDDYKSQPTGNAGARIACGVIKAG